MTTICSTCRKHFFRSFPRSWLITGFVTRLTQRVPLAEQELPTLPGHLSSPPVFSGVRVTRSLVLYVCFVDHCLSFCTFSFGHSSIYEFWLLFWYLKNLLIKILPDSSLEFSCYSIFLSYSMWHWRYFVSTVPADLQNILIGTATRRNDQEWTNFNLHEPCEPHGLSSGVCVCCSIDPSSVRSLLFVFMWHNFICLCCPHSWSETIQHNTYYMHGINCRSRR
jgi:hypothetical protein